MEKGVQFALGTDVICVSAEPSIDVSVLANNDHITHVWKGGVLYKGR